MGDSHRNPFRDWAGKYALVINGLTAGLLIYVRTEFVFERANQAGMLLLLIMLGLVLSLALGLIGLPRLESFVALLIFVITSLFFLAAAPLYVVP